MRRIERARREREREKALKIEFSSFKIWLEIFYHNVVGNREGLHKVLVPHTAAASVGKWLGEAYIHTFLGFYLFLLIGYVFLSRTQ